MMDKLSIFSCILSPVIILCQLFDCFERYCKRANRNGTSRKFLSTSFGMLLLSYFILLLVAIILCVIIAANEFLRTRFLDISYAISTFFGLLNPVSVFC